jgi:hypothetical protein
MTFVYFQNRTRKEEENGNYKNSTQYFSRKTNILNAIKNGLVTVWITWKDCITLLILLIFSRKKEARMAHSRAAFAQKVHGLRAKLFHKKRHSEKIQMKKM